MTNKKLFKILTLAAFAAMVVIAPLQAAPDCGKPGCPKKGDQEKVMGKDCMMKAEGCMMLKQIPNLTEEQKAKLAKLHEECQKMMTAAKADMGKLAGEMQALMKDPVDVKRAEAKIDELAKFHADMQKKCLAHRLAVKALLTDEQKAKLGEMGCAMGGCDMMGGKMMQGHGGCKMGGKHMEASAGEGCMKKCGQEQEKGQCQKKAEEEKK
jgi:Spy/CpxP family protein refolding chaperone